MPEGRKRTFCSVRKFVVFGKPLKIRVLEPRHPSLVFLVILLRRPVGPTFLVRVVVGVAVLVRHDDAIERLLCGDCFWF